MSVLNTLALQLYSQLMTLAQPLLRRKLARRGQQEPGYLEAIEERFGRYAQPAENAPDLVWLHAVSLGETRTAAMLLKALREAHPGLRILLTHGTATGRAEGAALLQAGDVQVWQPWDSPAAVARFFNHFKPRLGLLMETEIWPNLLAEAQCRAMPVVLVNGRLSEKSLKKALRVASLSRPAYRALTAVLAQTDADAARFSQLGANEIAVFGNLKFDATPSASQHAQGKAWRRAVAQPVLMFASSRDGEEELFLKQISDVVQKGRKQYAIDSVAYAGSRNVRILIVPRHPQRFDDVEALVARHGLRMSRRSGWRGNPADSDEAMLADVWLGDSLGEMALYYGLSDVALLGGSFEPLGGQNLIEAAACGCPMVMGPHTFNFAEAAAQAEAEGAALRVAGMAEAVPTALALIADSAALAKSVAAGLAFAARNRGAAARTAQALRPYL